MNNEYLRHTLSTIDYRFNKSIKYRNVEFGNFTLGKGSRTPSEIINHMYSVINSTSYYIQEGKKQKEEPEKYNLDKEIERFNSAVKNLDEILSGKELDMDYSKKLLQGPLSDVLTHIGQISMLSRLNDKPIEGEDFSAAQIDIGTT